MRFTIKLAYLFILDTEWQLNAKPKHQIPILRWSGSNQCNQSQTDCWRFAKKCCWTYKHKQITYTLQWAQLIFDVFLWNRALSSAQLSSAQLNSTQLSSTKLNWSPEGCIVVSFLYKSKAAKRLCHFAVKSLSCTTLSLFLLEFLFRKDSESK